MPPDVIIKNPKKAKMPAKKNLDALYATVSSLEAHIREKPADWRAGLTYALRKEMASDCGVMLCSTICGIVMNKLKAEDRDDALTDDLMLEMHELHGDALGAFSLAGIK